MKKGGGGEQDERPNGQTAPPDKHPQARTGGQVSPLPLVLYLWLGLLPKESVGLCQNQGIRLDALCGPWPDRFRLDGPVWLSV